MEFQPNTAQECPPMGREIVVWTFDIRNLEDIESRFLQILSLDERERVSRYRVAEARLAFLFSRGALRLILSSYLKVAPNEILFHYGPAGRPILGANHAVGFNVSHSGTLAWIAVAWYCNLGIDVELIKALPDLEGITKLCFSEPELDTLYKLPASDRQHAFYRSWTRKEAFLKALGTGLAGGPIDLGIPLDPLLLPFTIDIGDDSARKELWTIHDLALFPTYAAALAYEGSTRSIRHIHISDPRYFLSLGGART